MAGSRQNDSGMSAAARMSKWLARIALALMILPVLLHASPRRPAPDAPEKVRPVIAPQIPGASRTGTDRIFLEHANVLQKSERDTFITLLGDVEFSRGGMRMYCDSAHFNPDSKWMKAFGNVRMEQGDTLFIYAHVLDFRDAEEVAYLYGNPETNTSVRMINRDVVLVTPTFTYDLYDDVGFYTETGMLTDKKNELTSVYGEYSPSTKSAMFEAAVRMRSLTSPDSIDADTLVYNTDTHIAYLFSGTEIRNDQGVIYTDNGMYNTNTTVAELYSRSTVVTRKDGTTLTGDTLYYDRDRGFGMAWGRMELVDTADCAILTGDYGFYDEVLDSAFVTGRALAREYSQGDTLYLHARDIYSLARTDTVHIPEDTVAGTPATFRLDTTHIMIAHPRVRFYRSDIQGVCDSMRFQQRDSTLFMHRHPVVWSENRQIFGNIIQLHLNDSTIDRADLPEFGFSAEHIEDEFYNQLSGKSMTAYFVDGDMRRLDVNGNVEAIMLPMENDSTYNKIINVESSYLTADFLNQDLQKLKMWPETSGTVTPLYLAKKALFKLSGFKWYEDMRPLDPEDVFNVPESMQELMSDAPYPPERPRSHGDITKPEPEGADTDNPEEENRRPLQPEPQGQDEPLTADTTNPETPPEAAKEGPTLISPAKTESPLDPTTPAEKTETE